MFRKRVCGLCKVFWLVLVVLMIVSVSTLVFASGSEDKEKEGVYDIVIMPKLVGVGYYNAVKEGIDDAEEELPDVSIRWMGPTDAKVEDQIEMIENIIPTKPDLIAVASNDPVAISPVLKKAKDQGIAVMSWDGDTNFRDFFVNLVNYDEFGEALVESLVKDIGEKADIAIITTTFTAPNQVRWIEEIKRVISESYPGLNVLDIRPAGESTEKAHQIAQDYIKTFPTLKGMIVLGVPNVPGAVDALKEAGKVGDIWVVGNALPSMMREYLKEGSVHYVPLWSAPDHGYLTVYAAYHLLEGNIEVGKPFDAGRLGEFTPRSDEISSQVALPVMIFTKENVDDFNF
jgi:rhamnose transport system substrate-binding protein